MIIVPANGLQRAVLDHRPSTTKMVTCFSPNLSAITDFVSIYQAYAITHSDRRSIRYPAPLFTKRADVLPQDLLKSGNCEIHA